MNDTIIVPGAMYAEMGMSALTQIKRFTLGIDDQVQISAGVTFSEVFNLKDASSKATLSVTCHQDLGMDNCYHFDVTSNETVHATGKVIIRTRNKGSPVYLNLKDIAANHPHVISGAHLYDMLEKSKFKYGPSLRSVTDITTNYKYL